MIQRKNSKILLRSIALISILSGMSISCGESNWDYFKQAMTDFGAKVTEVTAPCVEVISNATVAGAGMISDAALAEFEALKAIYPPKAVFTGLGITSAGVGAILGMKAFLIGFDNKYIGPMIKGNEEVVLTGTAVIGAILGASLVRGIYNVRADNAMLQGVETKYGLTPEYNWYQKPGNAAISIACAGCDIQLQQALPFMNIVGAKNEKISNDTLFDFAAFTNQLPHTGINESYCIAKNYFNNFGCQTLGEMRQLIDNSLMITAQDFQQLKMLTNLGGKFKMPETFQDFNSMQMLLNQSSQSVVNNSFLGAFGYSPLHNGQRVKDYIMHVVKVHAYLNNLQQLFTVCSDAPDTLIQNQAGNLNFTLQHIHRVEIL